MKTIKRISLIAVFLCLVLAVASFAACFGDEPSSDSLPSASDSIGSDSSNPAEDIKVELSDSVITLDLNDTVALTVKTGGSENQTWVSKNPAIATVDNNGVVTAISEGNTEIEVTTANGKATCLVMVVNSYTAPVLVVANTEISLVKGDKFLLSPTMLYKGKDVTSEVAFSYLPEDGSSEGIVSAELKENGVEFKATAEGTVNYIVYAEYAGVKLGKTIKITVLEESIVFDVTNLTPVKNGYALSLSTYAVEGYLSVLKPEVNVIKGNEIVADAKIVYESANEKIAAITADGSIEAVGVGETRITGKYLNRTFTIDVSVSKPTLSLTAARKEIEIGRLGDIAFDKQIAGELVEVKIDGYSVGESVSDGNLRLNREALEELPITSLGENVKLAIETTKAKYEAEIDLYTLIIKSKQDYMSVGELSKAAEKSNDKLYGGYFVLGDNITVNGGMLEFVDRNKQSFNGDGSEGFCGVFDGKGYVIGGLTKKTATGNAFISVMHRNGVLKNIGFINASFESEAGSFLVHTGAGTIENVFIKYKKISNASTDGYSGTIFNADLTVNKVFIDASEAEIGGNGSKFHLLTANRWANIKSYYCVLPADYTRDTVTIENDPNYDNLIGKRAFLSFSDLKESETFTSMLGWEDKLWRINAETGVVEFGKPYVEPVKEQKTINVETTVRAELDINNDGSLNSGKEIGIDIAGIIGENDYTLLSVNGNGVASNVITANMFGYMYGNKTIEIVAETDNAVYTVNVPMLLVSKVIKTVEDYKAWGEIAMKCEDGGHNYGGYFELGNDIASESGSINMVIADAGAWDDASGGFAGTFDGCGYVIDGLISNETSECATFIGVMSATGVLRNIGFTNVKMNGNETFLTRTQNGTLENIYVHYKEINGTTGQTILARGEALKHIDNVFIDASRAVIATGSTYGILASAHASGTDIYGIVPNGFATYKGDASSGYGRGFASFSLLKAHEAWNTVKSFATASEYWHINEETGRVGFGKNYVEPEKQQKTINVETTVRAELDINNDGSLNSGKEIEIDIAGIIGESDYTLLSVNGNGVASNVITANMFGYIYGNKTIEIVAETDNAVYTVNVPMLFVSKVIKTVEDYKAWGEIAMKCEDGGHNYGGYFELGNDIASESGSINMVIADAGAWDDASGGFAGTFDGCGYVIDGLISNETSECATFIGVMSATGVLRNIGFTNVKMNGNETFLTRTQNGTLENIYVHYKEINGTTGQTILARGEALKHIDNVFIDASRAVIATGSTYGILASAHASGTDIYGIVPNGFATYKGDASSGYGRGFASFSLLKAHEAWNTVKSFATASEYWHINEETGRVGFGKNYVEPEKQQKTINVETTVRAELDINNDGSLNSGKEIGIDIAGIIGENDYTLLSVNGNGVASNVITANMFGYMYGNKTIEIVAETENAVYTVNVPMHFVSKVIKTVEDYQSWVTIAKLCEEGGHNYGGYFELGNDIVSESGSITMVYADAGAWDGAGGFSGTFDGCGYTIDGLTANDSQSYATFIGGMLENAELKNIGFTNVTLSSADTFLARTQYGKIENVYIRYKEINATGGHTLTMLNGGADVTVNNVFVDASEATIVSGSAFSVLANALAGKPIFGIAPAGTAFFANDTGSGYGYGFASFALLKAHENWNRVKSFATASEYWHINEETGEVSFGRKS